MAIDPRFMNYCNSCKSVKEPLAPIISSNNDNNTTTTTTTEDSIISKNNSAAETSDVAVDDMETDTDSSSTISGSGPDLPLSSSSAAATALGHHHHHNKLVDGAEDCDEGFFDKPAVSPSESGTSTPPPSSDPEISPHEYIRDDMVNTT